VKRPAENEEVDTPNKLLLLERHTDSDAIGAHRATAHYQDLVVERPRCLAYLFIRLFKR